MNSFRVKLRFTSFVTLALVTTSALHSSSSLGIGSMDSSVNNWVFHKQSDYPASHVVTDFVGNEDQSKIWATSYDAHVSGETLSISTDHGLSWRELGQACSAPISVSSDGVKIYCLKLDNKAVIVNSSSDGGLTWNSQLLYGDTTYQPFDPKELKDLAISSSKDGSKIFLAISSHNFYGISASSSAIMGGIFVSLDSGKSWTTSIADPTEGWGAIASSLDGVNLIASTVSYLLTDSSANPPSARNNQPNARSSIYVSHDSGVSWNKKFTFPLIKNPHYYSLKAPLASSQDGKYLYAQYDQLIYRSTDSGETWTTVKLPFISDRTITTSANGKQVAVSGGPLYFSNDYGKTWVIPSGQENIYSQQVASGMNPNAPTGWRKLLFSADGRTILGKSDFYNHGENLYSINLPAKFMPSKTDNFVVCSRNNGAFYWSFLPKEPYCRKGFVSELLFPK